MNMLEKINGLMKERGLNKHTLAEQSGIPYSTIVGIYSKDYKKIKLSTLRRLSDFFKVTMEYLGNDEIDGDKRYETGPAAEKDLVLRGRDEPYLSDREEERILKSWRGLSEKGRTKVEGYAEALLLEQRAQQSKKRPEQIRLFSSPAAAGFVSPVMNTDYELIERTPDVPSDADFAVRIRGDSMKPHIEDGSVVYVSENKDLKIGDVGIFFVDGDVFCKQYATDGRNLYLLSLNRARRDADITILESSGRTVYCFGKVLLKRRVPLPDR